MHADSVPSSVFHKRLRKIIFKGYISAVYQGPSLTTQIAVPGWLTDLQFSFFSGEMFAPAWLFYRMNRI